MKVQDIRSFFKKPGGSRNAEAAVPPSPELVEVPTRKRKVGKKTSKNEEEDDVLRGSQGTDDEDPIPSSSRKGKKQDKKSKAKKNEPSDDSDAEDPLPKSVRDKLSKKSDGQRKRKAKVLSDSDEDDFDAKKSSQAKAKDSQRPASKAPKVEKKEPVAAKPNVNPDDFFSSEPVKRKTNVDKREISVSRDEKKAVEVKHENGNGRSPKKVDSPHEKRPLRSSSASPKKVHSSSKPQDIDVTATLKKESSSEKSRNKSPKKPEPTRSPEKIKVEKPSSSKAKTTVQETKTPVKSTKKEEFKTPTPKASEKMKEKKGNKRSATKSVSEDEDDADNFNPKAKKPTSKKKNKDDSTPKPKKKKSDKNLDNSLSGKEDETEEEKEEKRKRQAASFAIYKARQNLKPKNLGMKEIPEGAPNCLANLTFVISGTLDSLERDSCKDIVEQYGGRVTGAVSRKTSYLIVGDEPGVSKISKAKALKIPQINEDEFLEMLRKSNPDQISSTSAAEFEMSEDEDESNKSLFESSMKVEKKEPSPKKSKPTVKEEVSPKKKIKTDYSPVKSEEKVKPKQEIQTKSESQASSSSSSSSSVPSSSLMWVDKYKPTTLKNVVGQTKDSSNAAKLVRWLQNWFKYHRSSQEKVKAAWPGLKDPEGKTFKCALLSGPPGIGKTTTAHLACKQVGYDFYELNASDTRNKKGLKENVADALTSQCLFRGENKDQLTPQHVLIMDEVDGMSGNEDRGGVQELIALIKSSRIPIICICNDRNHQKIRSLANYCYDLRFYKPTIQELKGFVSKICFKEKLTVDPLKMTQLMISADQDIRQILHQLELFKDGKSQQALDPKKDLRLGTWDVCRKVFYKPEHDSMNIHEKTGLFFQDYSFGPLFVQENYLKQDPAAARGDVFKKLDLISKSAAAIADGDLVDSIIRKTQNWAMLPVQAVFSSYIPGEYMESNSLGKIDFPQWLGKNSNKNKRHRLLQSLHTHVHLQVSGSLEALNMDYIPYLQKAIVNPLIASDHEKAAAKMETYALLRDDLESINELALWPNSKNPMDNVDTKTKSAFTRLVNKEMLPYSNAKPVKGKGKAKTDELEELDGDEEEVEEEEEDESLEKDAMIKMKARKATASSSKGKSKKVANDDEEKPSSSKAKGKGSRKK